MKILQISNHFNPCIGGIERVCLDISNSLMKKGHQVKVVCLDRCANSEKKLREKEKINNTNIERIPFLDLKYYKIALGIYGKIKWADVVHVHGIGFFSDFLLLTKWLHKKPVFVSTHGGVFHTQKLGFIKQFYFFTIQKIILNLADKIIAVSKNDLNLFKKISNNVILVENGVNVSEFKTGKKTKNSFIYLGRFSKNKRVELLLKTFAELKKINKNFSLIIAGTDWEKLLHEYKELITELGIENQVTFVVNPTEEEAKAIYSSSEHFVSASQYEGFGLAVVEAMASGAIPLVQKNEGHSMIVQNGKNGFFIDYSKTKKAAEQISKLIKKNNSEIAKNALKDSKMFSWGKKIDLLEKKYLEAMQK